MVYLGDTMPTNVNGALKSPIDEGLAATVRITAKSDLNELLSNSESLVITDASGSYNFTLVDGVFDIEIKVDDEYYLNGTVEVNAQTPALITLPNLIKDYPYVPAP